MTDQDREAFEAFFRSLPIHSSNYREYKLLQETWLAALAHARKQQAELVEAVLEMQADAVTSSDLMFIEEVDVSCWDTVMALAAQLKEQPND